MSTQKDIEIPDQRGKLALVTGANSGIGFGITQRLAAAGAEVILAVRNREKGQQAVDELLVANPQAKLSLEPLDLSSLQSVKELSIRLNDAGRPLHMLFNNAGIMALPTRQETADGFEMQFGTNYLGHFALTAGLLPLLRKAGSSRVVTLSSTASHFGNINFEDLQWKRRYSPWFAYGQSKLADLLFAFELNRQSQAQGWGILSNAAHPGVTRTNLQTTGPRLGPKGSEPPLYLRLMMRIPGVWQDIPQGSLPPLYAGTGPRAVGGGYYGPDGLGEITGMPKPARIPSKAKDEQTARRLWQVSEQLTHTRFPMSEEAITHQPITA